MLLRNHRSTLNALVLLTLTTFLISGCSSVQKLDVFSTTVERAPLALPNPETPKLEDIKWIIITSENAAEVFAKMQEQGKDPVLFGISDDDYELLAKNFAQIRAYMIQQGATLDQYREYYEAGDSTTTDSTND
jgi:hypothetical protein